MTDLAAVKNAVRRTELADFLRSRRERITPEQAGLPPAPRRRTPGLRREEVAQLAGVGVTWYTWLEQGRSINASTQVLDAIARTLQLDAAEHRHLYTLAQVPELRTAEVEGCMMPPEIQPILDGMNNVATVVNERFDMIAMNRHFEVMFPSVLSQAKENHNVFWCMFNLPGCCHPFVNRHETIPQMVAMLRGAYARHVGEPSWEKLIRDLIDYSEVFAELWSRNEVAGFGKQLRVYYQPAVGLLRFVSSSFAIHGTNGLRMQVMIPDDEATAIAHARLLSGEATRPEVLPCGHTWDDWVQMREDKPPLGSARG
ncbi:MAG TPA: helix-turn-helix transcriptional regulator [Actinospica sp.]|nr:helix-turn-helix transcriptional regulator [Actinospica sp.]